MNKNIFLLIGCCFFMMKLSAQVVINEYSASNMTNYTAANGNIEDWIELYNTGAAAVNLNGYYLSDDATNPTKWVIPAVNIPAGGRLMFFASGDDGLFNGQYHTSFKLTQTKGEDIVLADPAGLILDSVSMQLTRRNHSRGRTADGAATWGVFTTPTPNAANTGAFTDYAPIPVMSVAPGFYPSAQSVTITCSDATAQIRYTTDGSVPTATSTLYAGPINVATTTAIRAAAFPTNTAYARSFVETNTYFINQAHTMSVISVCGNYTSLFGGGTGNEIVSSFELFDATTSHNFLHEGDGDMNPHGNDSWGFPQKGIRFFPRDEYGYDNNIESQLFPQSTRDEFSCLIIKAGASDNYPFATTQNGLQSCHLRDVFCQTLAFDHDMHLDGRKWEPCVLYVNGQYWGLYEMRERVDKDFTEFYYNQGKKDVDIIRYWGGLIVDEGSPQGWNDLYNFVMNNNMAVQVNYDSVESQLDVMSLIDNFVLNTYFNNSDWLNWNTAWWRGRKNTANTPKVKWKYWMWDQDNTWDLGENYTGLPSTGYQNDPCEVTSLPQFQNAGPNEGHVDIFNRLMDNQTFKSLYVNRLADLLNTTLSCDTMDAHFYRIVNRLTPEMPNQITRWGGSMTQWQANLNYMRSQWIGKCALIDSQAVDCYAVTGPFPITINVMPAGSGNVKMSTFTPATYPYTGEYFGGVDLGFKATPNTNYVFDYWEVLQDTVSPNINSDTVSIFTDSPATLIAHFKSSFGASADVSVCEGQGTVLTMTGGTSPSWTTTTNSTPFSTASSVIVTPSVTTTYIVTTLQGVDSVTVTVNTIPTFDLGSNQSFCDVPSLLLAPTISGNTTNVTYQWQNGATTPTFTATSTGTYILITNNLGCTFIDSVQLQFSTTPAVNLGADVTSCIGLNSVLLDAGTYPNATYQWQDGSSASTFNVTQTGNYWVVVNNQGCIDRDSITLTIGQQPNINLGQDTSLCNLALSNWPLNANTAGNAPTTTYLWQDGATSATYNATQTGVYWVVANDRGCIDRDTIKVTIGKQPVVNLGRDTALCNDLGTWLLNAGGNGNAPTTTYLWQNGVTTPTLTATQSGLYWVVADDQGCIEKDSIQLVIGVPPVFSLGEDTVLCPGDRIRLQTELINVTHQWQDGTPWIYHFVDKPGTYWVKVTAPSGCTSSDTIVFSQSPLALINLGVDSTICFGDTVVLDASASNGIKYQWNTGDNTPYLLVQQGGTYTVKATFGPCFVEDTRVFTQLDCQKCEIFVPTGFTPNTDNVNDYFLFNSNCPLLKTEIIIYDRIGRILFVSDNQAVGWDGKFNNQYVMEGVYPYQLTYTIFDEGVERTLVKYGTITVIK